jgi:hypothetical protein
MPAWSKTLSDLEIWQIATFLDNADKLPPAAQKIFGPQEGASPMPMSMPMAH